MCIHKETEGKWMFPEKNCAVPRECGDSSLNVERTDELEKKAFRKFIA